MSPFLLHFVALDAFHASLADANHVALPRFDLSDAPDFDADAARMAFSGGTRDNVTLPQLDLADPPDFGAETA